MTQSEIDDIYPLTPLQRGMLFHAAADERPGMYIEQLGTTVHGSLDLDAFEQAWHVISLRHEALRTCFLWEDLAEPMQVVMGDSRITPRVRDWRSCTADEQADRLERFLADDRVQPFDPADAPLMRVTVIRLGEETHHLVCTNHHLVLDGWSRSVLFADLLSAYESIRRGTSVVLPPAATFRTYVEWLRARPVADAEIAWREMLSGLVDTTPVPGDPDRPALEQADADAADIVGAGWVAASLDLATTARLVSTYRLHGITAGTLAQAAWGLLLARHAGSDEVMFGVVAAGRPAGLDLDRTVGLFLNTVPARIRVDPAARVREWLVDVQLSLASAREVAHLPLARIAACSDLPPGSTMFDTLVVVENYPIAAGAQAGVSVSNVQVAERTDVALTLVVAPEETLHLRLVHDNAACGSGAARRLLSELTTLLAAMAEDPEQRVAALPLVSTKAQSELIAAWNPRPEVYPAEALITRVCRMADHRPDAVAVVDGERTMTYAALIAHARSLARRLNERGVAAESIVGVLVPPSVEQVIALLAVSLAGGAYLPIDPGYPIARIEYLLSDSGAQVVVVDGAPVGAAADLEVVPVRAECASPTTAAADAHPAPDQLAYVIYTSGSTGRPKGVLTPHRQVARLLTATEKWFGFGADDTWTLFHSASFDFSVWEMWGALTHGGRLVVASEGVRRSPSEFAELLRREAVTVLNQTPSAFFALSSVAETDHRDLPDLRVIVFGGEALDVDRLRPWITRFGHGQPRLVNMYGITETTVHVTHHALGPLDLAAGGDSVIGTPIPDLRIYVLDGDLRPVPIGVVGEIHVGRAGLARGYLHRPGLTADRFVPDPNSDTPGARVYRTGDLARTRADGTLVYASRSDDQVKVRGYRIELGEVAAALRVRPDVRDAIVVAREDTPGERRLVGYAVPADPDIDHASFVTAVRAGLSSKLPHYLVPSVIVPLESLPLTVHGKLDRDALPQPRGDRTVLDIAFETPRGRVETGLATVWSEVLQVGSVGRDDNFFALGGDSILSMHIASKAAAIGIDVTARQLFTHQTVAELAAAASSVADPRDSLTVDAARRIGPVALTPIQCWFFEQERASPEHYCQSVLLATSSGADPEAVRRAVGTLVRRHDSLRLAFRPGSDGWTAEVTPWTELPADAVRVVDLTDTGAATMPDVLTHTHQSHDLGSGCLVRAALVRLGEAGDRLLVSVHHLGVDAVSWTQLLAELGDAYAPPEPGEPPPGRIAAPEFPWRAYVERLTEIARRPDFGTEAERWRRLVADASGVLPVDRADAAEGKSSIGDARVVEHEFDPERTERLLRVVPGASDVEFVEVLHAAIGLTLAQWSGQSRVLVDVEGHGRDGLTRGDYSVPAAHGPGWHTALYPVALSGGTAATALRGAARARRETPDGGIGYGIVRYLRADAVSEALRKAPRRSALVNYLGRLDAGGPDPERSGWWPADEASGEPQSAHDRRHHDHEITAAVVGGRLRLRWTFSPQRHDEATIRTLMDSVDQNLDLVADHAISTGPADLASDGSAGTIPAEVDDPVDAVYRLSPMQEGMLFHLAYAEGTGINVEQVVCRIDGPLDRSVLRSAWHRLTERHDVLRTSFHWRDLERPVQVVHRQIDVPWEEADWTGLDSAEQKRRLEDLLATDRARPIAAERAPLSRVTLVRSGDRSHHLIWTHHHLLLDGWSLARLLPELMAFYRATQAHTVASLEVPPRPYRDYIAWIDSQDTAAADSLWSRVLGDFDAPTPLPVGTAASPDTTSDRGRSFELSADQTLLLVNFARSRHLTVNTLVQAAWALLLARHSGESNIVFGTVVSGRPANLPGAEDMIGQFINTVPVHAQVDPGRHVSAWLREFQEQLADARMYEYVPLVRIQGCSAVPRDTPLFETVVVFENYSVEGSGEGTDRPTRADDISIRELRGVEQTNYPLTLVAAPGARLRLQLLFDPDRYCGSDAEDLIGQLSTALMSLATDPERVADIELLDPAQVGRSLTVGNDTDRPQLETTSVLSVFAEQVAEHPGSIALLDAHRSMSYAELDAASDRFAAKLAAHGVGRGAVVALCLPRSVDLVVSVLGVFKAGAAYVPIDLTLSTDRIAYLLGDSDAEVVIADRDDHDRLPMTRALVLDQSDDRTFASGHSRFAAGPRDLAYVIYTSGSTGQPKGAMVEHRGMINHLLAKVEDLALDAHDIVAATASPSFDISVWQCLSALLSGGTTRIYDDDVAHDPRALISATDADGVTVLELVPSMLRAVLDNYPQSAAPALAALRWLLLTGEALPPDVAAGSLRLWPHLPLMNAYGPTECSDDVTHHVLRSVDEAENFRIPIGAALRNTRLYVLDDQQRPMPFGAAGELCVGGIGVGRGYGGRPGRTAAVFVPDPHGDEPGARLYRTGDRVRRLLDGALDFLGRLDHQVKVRGFRIELGEIESALLALDEVTDATVVLREDVVGDQRLVAYVVASVADNTHFVDTIEAHCAATLPVYAVPSAILVLPRIPLTPNGKIDRRALPAPILGDAASAEAPRVGVEQRVAEVWREVLGVARLDRQADFFGVGGHSLLAMRVIASLPQAGLPEMALRDLFESPRLADFAELVAAAASGQIQRTGPVPSTTPGDRPLSFAQQRLWFLDRWDPQSAAYNLPMAMRLSGRLDSRALRSAVRCVVERHESLRTVFGENNGEPHQRALTEVLVDLPVVDVSGCADASAQAHRLAVIEATRPFDLTSGMLLRAALIRLEADQHVLLLTAHHIASDGWSTPVLLRDIGEFYAAAVEKRSARLPSLPVQYADFAVWQRSVLDDDRVAAEIDHWRQELEAAPPLLDLPTDRPRPPAQTHHGANLGGRWSTDLMSAVHELAQQESATVFMVMVAAFATTLGRRDGRDDIVLGTPVAGRNHRSLDDMIGFFVNTLAVRVDLSGRPSLRELVSRVRARSLDAFAHQDLPFERLVEGLAPQRSLSYSPIFQVMLVLQNTPPIETGLAVPFLLVERFGEELAGATARFDLTISLREDGELHLNAEYDTALFDRDTVQVLLYETETLLAAALAHPDRPLDEFDPVPVEARTPVDADAAGPTPSEPRGNIVAIDLLRRQTWATPDAIAVVISSRSTTFRRLWTEVVATSRHLTGEGVLPGTPMALVLDDPRDMIVGRLAALHAGALLVVQTGPDPVASVAQLSRPDAGRPFRIDGVIGSDTSGASATRCDRRPDAASVRDPGNVDDPYRGSMVTHRQMADHARRVDDCIRPGIGERMLLTRSVIKGGSPGAVLGPLLCGVTVVLAVEQGTADPRDIVATADAAAATTLVMPSSTLAALCGGAAQWPASIHRVVCEGDSLAVDIARTAASRYPGLDVVALHSPAGLAGPALAWTFVEPEPDIAMPLGRPLADTRVYVLDARQNPVGPGTPGELVVAGAPVGDGFLHRPGDTAAAFIPDPDGGPGARRYRTGETVRRRSDGLIVPVEGRAATDRLHGLRIDLVRVETALRAHPSVLAAAATICGSGTAARLVGYVVLDENAMSRPGTPSPTFRDHCSDLVPEHLVPSATVVVERLPMDIFGRVDRGALAMMPTDTENGSGYVGPRSPTEEKLAALWSQVLGIDDVGIHDDFFDLGGHSLLAMRVQARVVAVFGVPLLLRRIFERPTVAGLAIEIDAAQRADADVTAVAMPARIGRIDRSAYRRP